MARHKKLVDRLLTCRLQIRTTQHSRVQATKTTATASLYQREAQAHKLSSSSRDQGPGTRDRAQISFPPLQPQSPKSAPAQLSFRMWSTRPDTWRPKPRPQTSHPPPAQPAACCQAQQRSQGGGTPSAGGRSSGRARARLPLQGQLITAGKRRIKSMQL